MAQKLHNETGFCIDCLHFYTEHLLDLPTFLTQSELIEPVLPHAAQLGNPFFYFFHNAQLEMHLLEGPD